MITFSNTANNVLFTGLKENIRLGEDVIKQYKRQFGDIQSSTIISHKTLLYKGNDSYNGILPKYERIADRYWDKLFNMREEMKKRFFSSFTMYVDALKMSIKKHKVVNCGEQSYIVQHELLKRGQKPHVIEFRIVDGFTGTLREYGDHSFVVLGMKEGAKIDKPNTWGKDAVIVDVWTGTSKPAQEAMRDIKIKFKFDPENETMWFQKHDLIII